MKKIIFSLTVFTILIGGCKKAVITGRVYDSFEKPLTDVNINIDGTEFYATTDSKGEYSIEYVPGDIKVLFSKQGYIDTMFAVNIATESKFPAKKINMYKIPKQQGIFLFGKDDFKPIH